MGFQTPQYKLARLLDWAGDGTIQLPDFQRGYKWEDERIRSLLTTVTLGHPLGVIMVLQTGSDHVRFKPKPLEGTDPKIDGVVPDHLLLDGQQRLTSLYQALTGGGVVHTKDSRGRLFDRRYYIDMNKAVGDSGDRSDAVVSVPSNGMIKTNFDRDIVLDLSTPERERAESHFPFRLVYDQTEAMKWMFAYPDEVSRMQFLTEVLQPMLAYEIPAIELDRSTTKGAVATVFEKVNTGGLALDAFELLTAMFAGDSEYYRQHGTDFRLNDAWLAIQQHIQPHAVLKGLASTDFLQAVTLLATRERNLASSDPRPPAISARKEDILKLQLTDYLRWEQPVRDALVWVAKFLADQHIHTRSFVPYASQIVPLAALRVILGEHADLYGVRERLSQWFWCGVLGELYGGSTETRFARDIGQVPAWAGAAIDPSAVAPQPVTVTDASFVESRLLSLRTRNAAAYKGIYALLMIGGCKDWKFTHAFDQAQYVSLAVDIHHVFPRKWCDDNGIDPDLRESVINKTPLAATTNRYVGGASPADYLPKIERAAGITSDQLDDLLRTHEIDPATLRAADFDGFFVARRAALLGLVEQAMGKPAQRDIGVNDVVGGTEAPDAFEPEPDDLDDMDDIDTSELAGVGIGPDVRGELTMAVSNRDRIGKMFDVLSPALDAFIQRVVESELTAGADWTMLVAIKDGQKNITGKNYSRTDPYLQLRMLSEDVTGQAKRGWHPFRAHLNRGQEGFASELRDVRHSWAHGGSFSTDDTYRALDTAERLLRTVGAVEAADAVSALRVDLRRVSAGQDERKVDRAATVQAEGAGLAPWREVLRPHEDVATGNFRASEFAADLFKVSVQDPEQSRDYTDPVEFFARTYLTAGLRDLIGWSIARLTGSPNAAPVINLQTNFGGGKTHSMLALWHLAAGRPLADFPQDVQEVLAASGYPATSEDAPVVRRVALVGNHLAPTGSMKPDGTQVNTMWGELAWQLDGRAGYDIVAEADRSRTHPGEALHTLLEKYSPAIILIDEWVAYARVLVGREDLAGGTFDTQFTFAQSLTEAVKATPGVLLAISIPASDNADDTRAGSAEEVGGENGREALRRLQNVVRRVADQWQPASAEESYEIVRRRLFVEPDADALAAIRRTARGFRDFYIHNSADFPSAARESEYEDRIRRSYPIHPELFERLYEDWSTLERFQRTRGVLRLMNHVIHELWRAGDTSPLIMPGSIPLAAPVVNSELTQYVGDAWRPIIHADVDGDSSVPATIDRERPVFGQRSLTRRLARTVFFGAAPTLGTAHVGLETQRVFLGTAVPGDVPGNFHSALSHLGDRATYFYSSSSRYWYDTQANISRRAKDQAERLPEEEVWAEIVRRLDEQRRTKSGFAAVSAAPEDSGDIPDLDEVRLVLVHPRYGHSRRAGSESPAMVFARSATEKHGSANRIYRNMVVFLAGDSDRLAELDTSVRQFLAWKAVAGSAIELNLTEQQKIQAAERRARADQTSTDRLLGAYHWVLVPEQKQGDQPFRISDVKAEGAATSLAERVTRKLQHTGGLAEQHTARLIRLDLDGPLAGRWQQGHISVGDLWTLYATYPYLRRLRNREMLTAGVRSVVEVLLWQTDGFALAESYDEDSDRYVGLVLPNDRTTVSAIPDGLLLVRRDRAEAQRVAEEAARPQPVTDPDPDKPTPDPVTDPADDGSVSPPPPPAKRRFFGTRTLSPDRYAGDFKKITDEVLAHLAAVPGVRLTVSLEIEAVADDGFDEDKLRTVGENARTLKFDQHGFEED